MKSPLELWFWNKKVKISLISAFFCCFFSSFTQAQDTVGTSHIYLNLSAGADRLSLRDKATSPLIYKGIIPSFRLSAYSAKEHRKYFQSHLQYAFGNVNNSTGVEFSQSFNHVIWFQAQQMYAAAVQRKSEWFLGGTVDLVNQIRINPKLMNNSFGLDFVQTLFFSAEYRYHIQAQKDKVYDFYLFKVKNRADRLKYFSFLVHVPLWLSSYRNGYAYANQTGVVNGINPLDGYEFKVWNGFRMMTQVSFVKALKNKNRYQLSYVWDAYKVGGAQAFTVAHHNVQFSLWYNLK